MRGGLPLFRFRGIKVLVHWSFLLLPAYIAVMGLMDGTGPTEIAVEIGLVLIVFVCVILHEFGHALTAQRYGVGTRDITLLPIGGVASLERMPEDPRQEFWITMAGPLVNLVIAGLAFLLIAVSGLGLLVGDLFSNLHSWTAILSFIFASNLGLFLFNLVPAFPMDGGRILRSLLSMRMPRDKATRIATGVGRFLSVVFIAYGILQGAPFLALIGLFIFMAAGSEARQVAQQTRLRSLTVAEVMQDPLRVKVELDLQSAWNEMTFGEHRVAIVMDGDRYLGMVLRDDLRAAMAQGTSVQLGTLVRPAPIADLNEPALPLYQRMMADGLLAVPVSGNGSLMGVVIRGAIADAINAQRQKA